MNPLHPSHLSAAERRAEVCTILATGLLRLRARQSDDRSCPVPESSLPITQHQSGHANPTNRRTA
jgi:hypothetical protein